MNLRQRLIAETSGVQDGRGFLTWDDTQTNSTTRWPLRTFYIALWTTGA